MKRLVRAFFLTASLVVLVGHAGLAQAQAPLPADAWPQRPIRMVVPFPAGGTADVLPRILVEKIRDAYPAGIVVENHKVDGLRPYGPDHGSLMESSPCHIPKGDKT